MSDLLSWVAPQYRRTDPETSALAAKDADLRASHSRMLVLKHLCERAMTDFELANATGIQQTSCGKRRGELRDHGYVQEARDGRGETIKRPAPSGSLALVWEITGKGLEYAATHGAH